MGKRTTKEKPKPKPTYKAYISLDEFNKRKKEWDEYYVKVRSTRAYKRFQEQREALRKGDMAVVKELADEARQDQIDNKRELTPPPYSDPEIERRYRRLGIFEWDKPIEETAEEVFS